MAFPQDELCVVPGQLRRRPWRDWVRLLTGQRFDRGPLGVEWIHGSPPAAHSADPALQVYWHDEHTAVLRQSKANR